jgi:hypothetical protein
MPPPVNEILSKKCELFEILSKQFFAQEKVSLLNNLAFLNLLSLPNVQSRRFETFKGNKTNGAFVYTQTPIFDASRHR